MREAARPRRMAEMNLTVEDEFDSINYAKRPKIFRRVAAVDAPFPGVVARSTWQGNFHADFTKPIKMEKLWGWLSTLSSLKEAMVCWVQQQNCLQLSGFGHEGISEEGLFAFELTFLIALWIEQDGLRMAHLNYLRTDFGWIRWT